MAKGKKATGKGVGTSDAGPLSPGDGSKKIDHVATTAQSTPAPHKTKTAWPLIDKRFVKFFMMFIVTGWLLGFIIGSGWPIETEPSAWKQNIGNAIRTSEIFLFFSFRGEFWERLTIRLADYFTELGQHVEADFYSRHPSHPRVFAVLREAVIREKGGYVHHDLGILEPAPSGAARGLGMVRNSYHDCQVTCLPGLAEEKIAARKQLENARKNNETIQLPGTAIYHQEEVLIRVPLNFQMTRSVALETLSSLVPAEVQKDGKYLLHTLDDAAILVLFLAHERGVGRYSRWLPYIASLPTEPSCGYSRNVRPYLLDTINALRDELGLTVVGWPAELEKASRYAEKITEGLTKDFGQYIETAGISTFENIEWALCQVASRATAGNEKYGSLRLIPLIDLINHDSHAGGFIELSGKESFEKGDFVEATEDDAGTFVVRSVRHGRRRPLKKGQELLVNYNVPHYTALDWFVSLGFVPPERWAPWQKIEPVLPLVRRDGPFAGERPPSAQTWKEKEPELLEFMKKSTDS